MFRCQHCLNPWCALLPVLRHPPPACTADTGSVSGRVHAVFLKIASVVVVVTATIKIILNKSNKCNNRHKEMKKEKGRNGETK